MNALTEQQDPLKKKKQTQKTAQSSDRRGGVTRVEQTGNSGRVCPIAREGPCFSLCRDEKQ